MKKCKDCGAMVSNSARKCPRCGKVLNTLERLVIIAVITAALAYFLVFNPAQEKARKLFDGVEKEAKP